MKLNERMDAAKGRPAAPEPAPKPDSCITTQIDRGALVLKPQQVRPSPVNEGNLDTGGHPLDQY